MLAWVSCGTPSHHAALLGALARHRHHASKMDWGSKEKGDIRIKNTSHVNHKSKVMRYLANRCWLAWALHNVTVMSRALRYRISIEPEQSPHNDSLRLSRGVEITNRSASGEYASLSIARDLAWSLLETALWFRARYAYIKSISQMTAKQFRHDRY